MLTCGRFKGNAYIYSQLLDLAVLILASWRRQAAAAKQILQRCLKGIKFADGLGFSKAMVWSSWLVPYLWPLAMLNLIHQVHNVHWNVQTYIQVNIPCRMEFLIKAKCIYLSCCRSHMQ